MTEKRLVAKVNHEGLLVSRFTGLAGPLSETPRSKPRNAEQLREKLQMLPTSPSARDAFWRALSVEGTASLVWPATSSHFSCV